jgi:hypothetical protein
MTTPGVNDPIGPGYDADGLLGELEERFRARSSFATPESAWLRLRGAFAAADLGHTVRWDPPGPPDWPRVHARWTCIKCGRSVSDDMSRREGQRLFGPAHDEPCGPPAGDTAAAAGEDTPPLTPIILPGGPR